MTSVHMHAMYAGICMHLCAHVCVHDLRSCTASHPISHSCSPNPHCLRYPQLFFHPFGSVWTVARIFPPFISGDCDKAWAKGQKFWAGSTEKHPSSLWWARGTHQKTCRKQTSYKLGETEARQSAFLAACLWKDHFLSLCGQGRLGCEANNSSQREGEADSLQTIRINRRQTRLFYLKHFLLL